MLKTIKSKIKDDEILSSLFPAGPSKETSDYIFYSYSSYEFVISIRDSLEGEPVKNRLLLSLRASTNNKRIFKQQFSNRQFLLDFAGSDFRIVENVQVGQRGRLRTSEEIIQIIFEVKESLADLPRIANVNIENPDNGEIMELANETVEKFKLFLAGFLPFIRPQRRDLMNLRYP